MQAAERYRIVAQLGAGATSEVFEAIAQGGLGFERRVVLKRLLPALAEDEALVEAFVEEARLAAQLHHANIAGVLDFGVMDGLPFQVVELVPGMDGAKLLTLAQSTGRGVPPEVALHLGVELASALGYAHEATAADGNPLLVVHRDVKPANILISWTGEVKLADFGIARARMRASRTVLGHARGTRGYMAPEQSLAADVDLRADLYAAGCVLAALILGRSPLEEPGAQARVEAGGELALPPSLPPDLAAIIGRATRTARQDRYPTAAKLRVACARALLERGVEDPREVLRSYLAPWRAGEQPRRSPAAALWDVALFDAGSALRRFASVLHAPPPAPARRAVPEEETDASAAEGLATAVTAPGRRPEAGFTNLSPGSGKAALASEPGASALVPEEPFLDEWTLGSQLVAPAETPTPLALRAALGQRAAPVALAPSVPRVGELSERLAPTPTLPPALDEPAELTPTAAAEPTLPPGLPPAPPQPPGGLGTPLVLVRGAPRLPLVAVPVALLAAVGLGVLLSRFGSASPPERVQVPVAGPLLRARTSSAGPPTARARAEEEDPAPPEPGPMEVTPEERPTSAPRERRSSRRARPAPPPSLTAAETRLARLEGRLPPAELDRLEARYLDLCTEELRASSAEERALLASRVRALLQDLERAEQRLR